MKKCCILAIDNGGSQIKGAVYDLYGHEIYSYNESPRTAIDPSGVIERDPKDVWKCNCSIISKLVKKINTSLWTIVAVSLCGYGGGTVLLDNNQKAISQIIVSTDSRARDIISFFEKSGVSRYIFELTHQKPWEGQLVPLLCWFAGHEAELFEKAKYALPIKDFIRLKLTGAIALELTDASNNNIIDPSTRNINPRLLDVGAGLGLTRFLKLPLLQSTDVAGYITEDAATETGIPQGTPVVAGLYDVCACTLGSGQLTLNTSALTVGTWVIASQFADSFQGAETSSIVTTAPEEFGFLIEQGSATGTINLNMVLKHIKSSHPDWTTEDLYRYCSKSILKYSDSPPDKVYVPETIATETSLLTSKNTLYLKTHSIDDEQKMLYSVLEGIAFSARKHLQLLQRGQKKCTRISLAGGITNSAEWSQLLCNIIGLPAVVMETSQNGALGAAMCAGVSLGEFDNFSQASDAMCHVQREIFPAAEKRTTIDMRYQQYLESSESMR